MAKQATPPSTRRRFAGAWSELDYVCKKISFWLYARKERAKAERFRGRLARLLRALPDNGLAILREEGWALLCELKEEIAAAITHREREIRLMERLQEEAALPRYSPQTRAYMLRDRGAVDLKKRRVILESLRKEHMLEKRTG